MNIATTKERILQYIDYKQISKSVFLRETGLKRGFLDADKLQTSISDVFIAKIIATYPEVNLVWLLTGKGEMLLNATEKEVPVSDKNIIEKQAATIKILVEENQKLTAQLLEAKEQVIKAYEKRDSEDKGKRTSA